MKVIIAFVRPGVLPALTQALLKIPGFPGMSVLDCQGFGRQKADSGQDYITFFEKKRLEIYTLDELVEPIVRMLVKAAHAGHPGDGKIYIENVTEGIRISSGERGGDVA